MKNSTGSSLADSQEDKKKAGLHGDKLDTGYPHDGRADKDSYPHDGRADKNSYPHDGRHR